MRLRESLQTATLVLCFGVMVWSFIVMIAHAPLAFVGLVAAGATLIYLAMQ
jgi:hypothetical protein